MVEKGERSADSEGVEPESDLGELDRHRVLVDAVDDALQDHAPNEPPVIELRLVDTPAGRRRLGEDARADRLDARSQR